MHISSLPSRHGIGTLGRAAYEFADFLAAAGQSYWQILPLGPTSYGDSPYASFSAFAGNPYFIDLDMLAEEGLLDPSEYDNGYDKIENIDYGRLYETRFKILRLATDRFDRERAEYARFCRKNAAWLGEYAAFMAIKDSLGGMGLSLWPEELRMHKRSAVSAFCSSHAEDVEYYKILQYLFFKQWAALKQYVNSKGIRIIGDIPIYVAGDSADLWSSPRQFALDKNRRLTEVAGCPPDAFSDDGQLWGNPLYDWEQMKKDGYRWWLRRIKHSLGLYDVVRIDHFRGFDTYWSIPTGDKTAKGGHWNLGPGIELFEAAEARLGKLPIIAEDLGDLLPSVRELLQRSGFPGMKVLQFAFDPDADSEYLLHNCEKNSVIYTGTHDNDTIVGWFNDPENARAAAYAREYLRVNEGEGEAWAMIKTAMAAPSEICIMTMQDIVCLGSEARMNKPATLGGNWTWRIDPECINEWLAREVVYKLTATYKRLPEKPAPKCRVKRSV